MKGHEIRIYLSPYLDSVLDPTTTYEVSRHLETCRECAQIFKAEGELEHAICERLRRPHGDEEQVIERALSRVLARRSRFEDRRALLIAASLLFLLGFLIYRVTWRESDRVPDLITMVAEDHRRYIHGEVTPELLTADPAALAPFFEGKLSGEIGSIPMKSGWEMEGARVCRFREIHVAFITLRYHGIPVSVVDVPDEDVERATGRSFVLPSDERCFDLPGGRGILRRTSCGLRVVFGDIEMAKLEEVALAAR